MGVFLVATVAYLIFKCVTRRLKRLQILPIAMIPNSNAGGADRPDDNQTENLADQSGPNGNNRVFYILVVPGSDPSGVGSNAAAGSTDVRPQAITASDGSIYAHYSGWHYKKTRPPSYDVVMRQDATLGFNGSSRRPSRATTASAQDLTAAPDATTSGNLINQIHENGAYQNDEASSSGSPLGGHDLLGTTMDPSQIPPPSYDKAVRRNSRRKSMISTVSNV
uniref:Uncharacterized protein n=1 Tax=Romanomermis culicivorax TaxID=13658 RepID=A0A915IM04_ROMCU